MWDRIIWGGSPYSVNNIFAVSFCAEMLADPENCHVRALANQLTGVDMRNFLFSLPLANSELLSSQVMHRALAAGQEWPDGDSDYENPLYVVYSICADEYTNRDCSMLQNVFPQEGTKLIHRLVALASSEQRLTCSDFLLLSAYLISYPDQVLAVLRSFPKEVTQKKSSHTSSRRSCSATTYRPAAPACDRLISAILLTLNAAESESTSPSVLAHAVTCLAFLVSGHSNPESILGVESNVLQMVRLCLSRTVYPAEETLVWDTALSRLGLQYLLRIPCIQNTKSVQNDICSFCSKWIHRLAGAAANEIDKQKGGNQSRVNISAKSCTGTKFFPLPDSSLTSALTTRAALQVLESLAQLCVTNVNSESGNMRNGPFEWLRSHLVAELTGTKNPMSQLMWFVCCACPFSSFAALNLTLTLASLEVYLGDADTTKGQEKNLKVLLSDAVREPCVTLLASTANIVNVDDTHILGVLRVQAKEVLDWCDRATQAPAAHPIATSSTASFNMEQSSDEDSVEIPLKALPSFRAALSESAVPPAQVNLDLRAGKVNRKTNDSILNESVTTLSLTSVTPIAMGASQTPPHRQRPSPHCSQPLNYDSQATHGSNIEIETTTGKAQQIIQEANYRLQVELLAEQRRSSAMQAQISGQANVLEEKDSLMRKLTLQMATIIERHDKAIASGSAATAWANEMQNRYEQQQKHNLDLETSLAQAQSEVDYSRTEAAELKATLAESNRMMVALQASILNHESAYQTEIETLRASLQRATDKAVEMTAEKARLSKAMSASEEHYQRKLATLQQERDDAKAQAISAQQELSTHRELIGYINKISGNKPNETGGSGTNKENCHSLGRL